MNITTIGELELATVITALRAWRIALSSDEFDSALVDENLGTLTADEIGEFLTELTGEEEPKLETVA